MGADGDHDLALILSGSPLLFTSPPLPLFSFPLSFGVLAAPELKEHSLDSVGSDPWCVWNAVQSSIEAIGNVGVALRLTSNLPVDGKGAPVCARA